jgi:phage tail sheath protein FI
VIFGQKTMQLKPSALDRVNVRRLLILAKRAVAGFARNLLFEPNNPATWTRFVNKVNPILEGYRSDQGINRFKVVMDSTTNTSDVIDRNEMRARSSSSRSGPRSSSPSTS